MPDGRYGRFGKGEPPIPGMSKMIAVVSVRASRKGLASCQFAPMPLNRRSGGRDSRPRFTATISS